MIEIFDQLLQLLALASFLGVAFGLILALFARRL